VKARDQYGSIVDTVKRQKALQPHSDDPTAKEESMVAIPDEPSNSNPSAPSASNSLALIPQQQQHNTTQALIPRRPNAMPKPKWHSPWKLCRVISGHLGWVRCVAVEPGNEWFVTGAADRVIKVWDLASGTLKVSLTGHISTVRGLAVSPRHPYLFSCGEDRQVKCWDLEYNKV
jgi:pleiotropic regulator 1